ncbi:MAG: glycosyltransferase, partial [Verrucomicrobia bacterium]|nr:glycosyltransferase [Verrucomicrobiota bacterium]
EAAARLQARHPAVSFLIVGSPFPGNESHLAALQSLVKARGLEGRVRFIGHLDDTRPALAALDVSIMASVEPEPLGNVTIESMALGKAVVGTHVGGTAEIVQDGITGLLVPPNDPAAMAAAIEQLLKDADQRTRMGAQGRARFLRLFEFEFFYSHVLGLYTELASSRADRGSVQSRESGGPCGAGRGFSASLRPSSDA